jgi:hypothetical protein
LIDFVPESCRGRALLAATFSLLAIAVSSCTTDIETLIYDGGLDGPSNHMSGSGCESDGECISGYCRQGVCCKTECAGQCLACNVKTNVGSCVEVPKGGADPTGTCKAEAVGTCGRDGT